MLNETASSKHKQCLILLLLLIRCAVAITIPGQGNAGYTSAASALAKQSNYMAGHDSRYTKPAASRRIHFQHTADSPATGAAAGAGGEKEYVEYFASVRPQKATTEELHGKIGKAATATRPVHYKPEPVGKMHGLIRGFTPTKLTVAGQHYATAAAADDKADGAGTNDDESVEFLYTQPNYEYSNVNDYQVRPTTGLATAEKVVSDLAGMQRSVADNAYAPQMPKNIPEYNEYNNIENDGSNYFEANSNAEYADLTPTNAHQTADAAAQLQGYEREVNAYEPPYAAAKQQQQKLMSQLQQLNRQQQLQQHLYNQYKQQQEQLANAYARQLQATAPGLRLGSPKDNGKVSQQARPKRAQFEHALHTHPPAPLLSPGHIPPITTIVQHNALSAQAIAGIPLAKHTTLTKQIPVQHVQRLHVPYRQNIRIPIPQTQITTTTYRHPIEVPVTKTVAVPEMRDLKLPIEKVRAFPVERPVPFIVEKRVPYRVDKPVVTPVYYPMPIKVPIMRTIVHKIQKPRIHVQQSTYTALHGGEHAHAQLRI